MQVVDVRAFDTPLTRAACIGFSPERSSPITSNRRDSANFSPATTPSKHQALQQSPDAKVTW